jgi:hypothetical protein
VHRQTREETIAQAWFYQASDHAGLPQFVEDTIKFDAGWFAFVKFLRRGEQRFEQLSDGGVAQLL